MSTAAHSSLAGVHSQETVNPGSTQPAPLELRDIYKRFKRTIALDGVSFGFRPGRAHALLGENGSGKSTLMKIASGEYRADQGRVLCHGVEVDFRTPAQAAAQGITMVAQEVPVLPELSIAENVYLGRLGNRYKIDWGEVYDQTEHTLAALELTLDPRQTLRHLGPSQRQLVAIARALACDAKVVIFDEPTSSLDADQTTHLFDTIEVLKDRGVAVAFISQRLADIRPVADDVTILRDGKIVGTLEATSATEEEITSMMIGRSLEDYFHAEIGQTSTQASTPVLAVESVSVAGRVEDVSFSVNAGEIFGMAGQVGSGKEPLLRAIFGLLPRDGQVSINDQELVKEKPAASISQGLAFVSGDRRRDGIVGAASLADNLMLVETRASSLKRLAAKDEFATANELVARLQIRPADLNARVGLFSGGNQQKVAIGRWLVGTPPAVLILDEPTRGVDVGAKSEIYRLLRELAAQGTAVLISSSEASELLGVCDRVGFMVSGKLRAIHPVETLNEWTIAQYITQSDEDTGEETGQVGR